jgi:hypothetical protein
MATEMPDARWGISRASVGENSPIVRILSGATA